MQKVFVSGAALALIAVCLPALAQQDAAVTFKDKNLEAAIRAVLFDAKSPLTEKNLANVFVLEATGKGITDLSGLEKCKNLALLNLGPFKDLTKQTTTTNQVTDLGPLKDLTNLQSLNLAANKISNVGPLAGLSRLQYLELSDNQVSDVAPLAKLTSMASLYLSGNKISDLKPLGGLVRSSR